MDMEVIKAALDNFENDDFMGAKEKLQSEIRQGKNEYLKVKLGLANDIEPKEPEKKVVKSRIKK